MLQDVLATLLTRVLGTFVSGIDARSLQLSVWRGEVRLTRMALRPAALAAMALPVRVMRGEVGEVVVRFPWRSLGRAPLLIELHDVTLIVAPVEADGTDVRAQAERDAPAKHEALAAWEAVQEGCEAVAEESDSFAQRLANRLLKSLEIRTTNLHLGIVEGGEVGAIQAGVVLGSLSLTTPDAEAANSLSSLGWFSSSLPSSRARPLFGLVNKTVQVSGLVVYLSPNKVVASAQSTAASSSTEGEARIAQEQKTMGSVMHHAQQSARDPVEGDTYLLAPLHASAQIELDVREEAELGWPKLTLGLQLQEPARLSLTRPQLLGALQLIETLEQCQRRHKYRECQRPREGEHSMTDAIELWKYAIRAVMWERRTGRLYLGSAQLAARRSLRLRYTETYITCLAECAETLTQPKPSGKRRLELAELELMMPLHDICTFRAMARRTLAAQHPTANVGNVAGVEEGIGRKEVTEGAPSSPSDGSPSSSASESSPSNWTSWFSKWRAPAGEGSGADGKDSRLGAKSGLLGQLLSSFGDSHAIETTRGAAYHESDGTSRGAVTLGRGSAHGGASEPRRPRAESVRARISAHISQVEITLLASPGAPIACLQLNHLALVSRVRSVNSGVGISASVGSLRLLDLSTPWPQLRVVCHAGRRAVQHSFAQVGQANQHLVGLDALTVSAETEPLHSNCAVHLDVRLAGLRLLLNPNLVAAITTFATVPPSHWAIVLAIEQSTRRVAVTAAASSVETFGRTWRDRPVNVQIHYSTAWYMLVETPPPLPARFEAGARNASSAHESDVPPLSLRRVLVRAGDIGICTTDPQAPDHSHVKTGSTHVADTLATPTLSTSPSASSPQEQQQLHITWEGLCAAVLPPGDPDGWVDGEAEACMVNDGDDVLDVGGAVRSSGLHAAATAAPPDGWQLLPFSAAVRLTASDVSSVLLDCVPNARLAGHDGDISSGTPAVGMLRVSGALSMLVLRLDRQQLLSAASIALSLVCALESDEDSRTCARQVMPRGARCGWLSVSEHRRIAGHTSSSSLGICFVSASRGWLSYTSRDGSVRHVRVVDSELEPDGPTALRLTRRTGITALGGAVSKAGIEWSVRLIARSRSEARQWLSGCAAMQGIPSVNFGYGALASDREHRQDDHPSHPAVVRETKDGGGLSRNGSASAHSMREAKSLHPESSVRTASPELLRRQVEILILMPGIEVALLSSASGLSSNSRRRPGGSRSGGMPSRGQIGRYEGAPLLQFAIGSLRCEMCTRLHDAQLVFSSADVHACCGVAEPVGSTGNEAARQYRLVPLLHIHGTRSMPTERLVSPLLAKETMQLSRGLYKVGLSRAREPSTPSGPALNRESHLADELRFLQRAESGQQFVPAISSCVATYTPGSPEYAMSRATLSVDGHIGGVTLTISPAAMESLCSNGLWVYYQLSFAWARYSAITRAPFEGLDASPSPCTSRLSTETGHFANDPSHPMARSTATKCQEGLVHSEDGPDKPQPDLRANEKIAVSLLLQGLGPVTVLLQDKITSSGNFYDQDPSNHDIGDSEVICYSVICELQVLQPRFEVELSRYCADYRATVGSFSLCGRESDHSPEVTLVRGSLDAEEFGDFVSTEESPHGSQVGVPGSAFAHLEIRCWDEMYGCVASQSTEYVGPIDRHAACPVIRPDYEITMFAHPIIVILPAQLVRRIELCSRASFVALTDALDTALEEASAAVVCATHTAATHEQRCLASLSLILKGPLVVLPSPSAPNDALLLQLADVELTNNFEYRGPHHACECIPEGTGKFSKSYKDVDGPVIMEPDAPTESSQAHMPTCQYTVCESVQVRVSNSRLVVARDAKLVGGAHPRLSSRMACDGYRSIFDDIDIAFRFDRHHELSRLSTHDALGESNLVSQDCLPPPELHVDLATVSLSLTYGEGLFVTNLVSQLVQIFSPEVATVNPDIVGPARSLSLQEERSIASLAVNSRLLQGDDDDSSDSGSVASGSLDERVSTATLSEDSSGEGSVGAQSEGEDAGSVFLSGVASRRLDSTCAAGSRVEAAEQDDCSNGIPRPYAHLRVSVNATAIRLRLSDDSAGSLLPLYEANVHRLSADVVLFLDEEHVPHDHEVCMPICSETEPASADGSSSVADHRDSSTDKASSRDTAHCNAAAFECSVEMALELELLFFNPAHGLWEPIAEPWQLYANWRRQEPSALGPSTGSTPEVATQRPYELSIASDQPLELNITHALLCSFLSTGSLIASGTNALATGHVPGGITAKEMDADVETSYAVLNLTEIPLSLSAHGSCVVHHNGRESTDSGQVDDGFYGTDKTNMEQMAVGESMHSLPLTITPGRQIAFSAASNKGDLSIPFNSACRHDVAQTANCEEIVAAARVGNASLVLELLHRSADVHSVDSRGRGALHMAAKQAHIAIIRILLSANADVEMVSGEKLRMRPLHFAALSRSLPCVQLLLQAGANPMQADAEGRTPAVLAYCTPDVQATLYSALNDAVRGDSSLRFNSAELLGAIERGMVNMCRSLLATKADPNSADGSHTALSLACSRRYLEIVGLLLEAGATVNHRTGAGTTPLHIAAATGPRSIVQALLHAGASPIVAREEKVGALEQPWALPVELATWRTRSGVTIRSLLWEATLPKLVHCGWLYRLCTERSFAGERKGWFRRFVLLLPDQLRFFSDYKLRHYRGRIPLASLRKVTSPSSEDSPPSEFTFELATTSHTMALCSDTAEERAPWLQHLRALASGQPSVRMSPYDFRNRVCQKYADASCVVPMKISMNSAGNRGCALEDELSRGLGAAIEISKVMQRSGVVTLLVGSAYKPIEASIGKLGLSVVMLTPEVHRSALLKPTIHALQARVQPVQIERGLSPPAGILLDVAIRRGKRTLTVKSVVEVVNHTALALELRVTGEVDEIGRASSTAPVPGTSGGPTFRLDAGEASALPIALTHLGSEAACRSLEIRPAPTDISKGEDDVESLLESQHSWASLTCDRSGDTAVVTCEHVSHACIRADNPYWTCCVSLEFVPLKNTSTTGAPSRVVGGRQPSFEAQLARFELPASEMLLGSWPCVLNERMPAPCWLFLTPNYLCYHAGMRSITAKIRLDDIAAVRPRSNLPSIEVQLDSGKRLLFSGLIKDRDEVLHQICEVRAVARQQWASGLALWRPRRVVLRPPLLVENMLPCVVVLELKQMPDFQPGATPLRATASRAKIGVEDWLRSALHAPSSVTEPIGERTRLLATSPKLPNDRRKSSGGRLHRSMSIGGVSAMAPTQQLARVQLDSGRSEPLHSVHLMQPLHLLISIGAGDVEDYHDTAGVSESMGSGCLSGQILLLPPSEAGDFEASCVLHPTQGSSMRALKLVVRVRAGDAGTYTLTISAAHWLRNHSSVDVSLHDARMSILAVAHARSANRPDPDQIFDLPDRKKDDKTSMCCLSTSSPHSAFIEWAESNKGPNRPRGENRRGLRPGETASAAFSIRAVGHQRELVLPCADGSLAPIVVSVAAASGPLAGAGATVVVVSDRCVLRNQTGIDLEWTQTAGSSLQLLARRASHIHLLPSSGEPVPVRWHWKDDHGLAMVSVRTHDGQFAWCAPFSPDADAVLKLWPSSMSPNTSPLHFQLTIGINEHGTKVALLRPATRLPYRLRNDSSLLLAFRQHGANGDWEVLGPGESCPYTWDDPHGRHLIQTHVQDDGGEWQFTAPGTDSGGYAMECVGRCPDLKLEPQRVSVRRLARPQHETVLLTIGASLVLRESDNNLKTGGVRRGDTTWVQSGWLCLTSRHIGFVPLFAQPPEGKDRSGGGLVERSRRAAAPALRLARAGATAAVQAAPETVGLDGSWASLFPIPLSQVRTISAGPTPGELVLELCLTDSHACGMVERSQCIEQICFTRLRDRQKALDRMRAVLSASKAPPISGVNTDSVENLVGALDGDVAAQVHVGSFVSPLATSEPSSGWRLLARAASRGAAALAAASTASKEAGGMVAIMASKEPRRNEGKVDRGEAAQKSSEAKSSYAKEIPSVGSCGKAKLGVLTPQANRENSCAGDVNLQTPIGALYRRGKRLRSRNGRRVTSLPSSTADLREPLSPVSSTNASTSLSSGTAMRWEAALLDAIQIDDRPRVKSLLGAKVSPDACDARGMSALHWACELGRPAQVHLLLRAGGNVELPTRDGLRRRPLHVAASCRSAPRARTIIRFLLSAGANPTARCSDGRTAASFAPVSRVQRDLVLAEAEWRSRVNRRGPLVSRPALVHAVVADRPTRVAYLLAQGADPDSLDEGGMSSLHRACAIGDAEMAQTLLRAGASPNISATNKLAMRPLHCAARCGSVLCIALLLEAGADPLRQDRAGLLPLDRCATGSQEARLMLLRATLRSRAGSASRAASRAAASALVLHAKVVALGPLRELQIWDESLASIEGTSATEGNVATNCAAGDGDGDGVGKRIEHGSCFALRVNLRQVGISLIDEEPREVLHLAMRDVRVLALQWDARQRAELLLGHVQLDSSLKHTRFPVILAPLDSTSPSSVPGSREASTQPFRDSVGSNLGFSSLEDNSSSNLSPTVSPVSKQSADTLRLEFCRSSAWLQLAFLEYVRVRVTPLRLAIEQNTAARVLRFALSIWDQYEASSLAQSAPLSHPPKSFPPDCVERSSPVAATAALQQRFTGATPPIADEVYVKHLEIAPVRVVVSVNLSPLCHEPALQPFHPTNNLLGLARSLVSLHDSELRLDSLELTERLFESVDVLSAAVASHYSQECVQQVYRILGSLDAFGNPSTVLKDVSRGVSSLRRREKGFKGFREGTTTFAGGVAGGTAVGALTLISNLAGGISNVSGAVSLDPWYNERRALVQQAAVRNANEGFRVGMRALGDGMLGGVAGMVELPIRGAIEGGQAGFWKGAAQGLLGLVAKPVGGVGSLVSKASEGIAADAKRVTPTGGRERYTGAALRVRQPRVIGPDGVLRPYPRRRLMLPIDDSQGAEIFSCCNRTTGIRAALDHPSAATPTDDMSGISSSIQEDDRCSIPCNTAHDRTHTVSIPLPRLREVPSEDGPEHLGTSMSGFL